MKYLYLILGIFNLIPGTLNIWIGQWIMGIFNALIACYCFYVWLKTRHEHV